MSGQRGSRISVQIKALLSLGLLAGFGAVSTLAAWTGTATTSASISAGTVSLGVGATAGNAVTYTLPITGTNWYPGMSQAAAVVVTNSGSLSVPYSITGSIGGVNGSELGKALEMAVTGGGVQGASPNATCTGTTLVSKTAGADFPNPVTAPTVLAPGASQTLCVQYSLPIAAASALQGKSTTVTLTFTASVGS